MKLNEALKRCRKLRKATQKQAAAAAGVTESMYQFYEYGKSEPTASVCFAPISIIRATREKINRNILRAARMIIVL